MKAKCIAALFCLALLVTTAATGHAAGEKETVSQPETLIDLSDRVFQYAGAKQYQAAKEILNEFDGRLRHKSGNYRESDRRVVEMSSLRLKLLLDQGVNHEEIRKAAVSFRLCVDALVSDDTPLWRGLRQQVMSPLVKIKDALKKGSDPSVFQTDLNHFLDSYAVVYPSMVIDSRGDLLRMVNTRINKLAERRLSDEGKKEQTALLNQIQRELNQIFRQKEKQSEDALGTLAAVTGGLVIAVLSYVSWRKFYGSRQRQKRGIR